MQGERIYSLYYTAVLTFVNSDQAKKAAIAQSQLKRRQTMITFSLENALSGLRANEYEALRLIDGINEHSAEALAGALAKNNTLEKLHLQMNGLNDEGVANLADPLIEV